jgi:phosphate transport system substrate-binding protein
MAARRLALALALTLAWAPRAADGAVDQDACTAQLDRSKAAVNANGQVIVQGAGASFPNRLYQDSVFAYALANAGVAVTYASLGSGKGVCRIKSYCDKCAHPFVSGNSTPGTDAAMPGNVDFAGSDAPLVEADYAYMGDAQMYPAVAGAVVPIFNLGAVGLYELVLSPLVMSQIFRQCLNASAGPCQPGSISLWNDPAIVALNPGKEAALGAAGAIQLIVREDSSGTTEIFKKSLSSFDPAFLSQVGVSQSGTWSNVRVRKASTNAGVTAVVVSQPSSIGYSVLAEAVALGVSQVSILKPGASSAVRATPESLAFAVMEKGLDFGNSGEPSTRLVADIHNAKSALSWPIAGYTYFVLRKNATRYGGDCANRAALLAFFEWFYQDNAVKLLAAKNGFAVLPSEVSALVLGRLRRDMYCNGEPVYKPPADIFQSGIRANKVVAGSVLTLLRDVYSILDSKITLPVLADDAPDAAARLLAAPHPVIQIGFSDNFAGGGGGGSSSGSSSSSSNSNSSSSGVRVVPFFGVASGVVFSLCGAEISACSSRAVTASMTPQTLAKVLSGAIADWSHPELQLALAGNATSVGSRPIAVVRAKGAVEAQWEARFVNQLAALTGTEVGLVNNSNTLFLDNYEMVKAAVYATPFALAVVPITAPLDPLGALAGIVLPSGNVSLPTIAAIESGEYPFVTELSVGFPASFSDASDCALLADGLAPAGRFARLVFWLLHGATVKAPTNQNGMGFLSARNPDLLAALEDARYAVTCNGVSLMAPAHELHIVPGAFRMAMYVLLGLFAALATAASVWIVRHSRDFVVRASTHTFMLQILFGAVIAMTTVVPLLQDDSELFAISIGGGGGGGSSSSSSRTTTTTTTSNLSTTGSVGERAALAANVARRLDFACMSIPFFFFTGYSFIFTPLLLKTWRINMLLNHKKIRRAVVIPNSLLIKMECVVLCFVGLILGLWAAVDPLRWERTVLQFDSVSGLPTESIGRCVCEWPMRFLAPLLVATIASIIAGVHLSYIARDAPVAFSEGKWIAVALVNFLECFTLCTPILAITSSQPQLDIVIKCMFVSLVSLGTTGFIFGPKIVMWSSGQLTAGLGDFSRQSTTHSSSGTSTAGAASKVFPSREPSSAS